MSIADIKNIEVPGRFDSPETPKEFIPTPERVSQYLELKTEEVETQMKSVDGRKGIYDQLLMHVEDLKQDHKDFNPEVLKRQLDDMAKILDANNAYLQEVRSPEQQGVFRRAWEAVKKFPRNHPFVTAALAAAVVAGGVAAGFYAAGNLELLLSTVGLGHLYGEEGAAAAAETMGELIDGASKVPDYFDGPGGGSML